MRLKNVTSLLAIAFLAATAHRTNACPYCTVESATLAEEMAGSDVVVLARLIKPAAPVTEGPDELGQFGVVDPETGRAKFKVVEVLQGEDVMVGVEEIEAVFFGEPDTEQTYFLRGIGTDQLDWNIPMPMSETAVDYVKTVLTLPEEGPERMRFFLDFVQHEDPLLAQDAYDEFARAPYADVIAIADDLDREKLWGWIVDTGTSANRRSLFFTMLGVVGTEEDQQRLEQMMFADNRVLRSAAEAAAAAAMGLGGAITLPVMPEMVAMEQRQKQLGFNAMVGCYLKLTGNDGLDVLDREFLSSADDDPTKVYGVLLALRFLADETEDVPIDRLIESMRLVLAKPDFAEQAIRDLARWEDWTVLDQLVEMFKNADENSYVRDPIVAYLDQAAKQPGDVGEQATTALAELEPLDPRAFKRARSLMAFGFLGYSRAGSLPPGEAPALNKPEAAFREAPLENASVTEEILASDEPDDDALPGNLPPEPWAMEGADDAPLLESSDAPPLPLESEAEVSQTIADEAPAAVVDESFESLHDEEVKALTAEASEGPTMEVPSRWMLMTTSLMAAVVLAGVVWLVLRSGV